MPRWKSTDYKIKVFTSNYKQNTWFKEHLQRTAPQHLQWCLPRPHHENLVPQVNLFWKKAQFTQGSPALGAIFIKAENESLTWQFSARSFGKSTGLTSPTSSTSVVSSTLSVTARVFCASLYFSTASLISVTQSSLSCSVPTSSLRTVLEPKSMWNWRFSLAGATAEIVFSLKLWRISRPSSASFRLDVMKTP